MTVLIANSFTKGLGKLTGQEQAAARIAAWNSLGAMRQRLASITRRDRAQVDG